MPNKKSCVKRLKQDAKKNARNRAIKSRMASAVKRATTAPPEEREAALRAAVSVIDKAAKHGAIKRQTAARKKSRLVAQLSTAK